jgi:hypothetical protein
VASRPGTGLGTAAFFLTALGALTWIVMLAGPVRVATGLLGARSHLRQMERAFRTELNAPLNRRSNEAGDRARAEANAAVASARRASDGHRWGAPIFDLALALPKLRGLALESPDLLVAGEAATEAAQRSIRLAQDSLGPRSPIIERSEDGSRIVIDELDDLRAEVIEIMSLLDRSANRLRDVRPTNLPARFRSNVRRSIRQAVETQVVLGQARDGLDVLPGFLGADGRRTYLLGMQNPAELRGTGGAMLQMAYLTATDGKLELDEAGSIYNVDTDRRTVDIPIPRDAWYVREIPDAQRFGNANWSPDWPLSAELTVRYAKASSDEFGVPFPDRIDGVIGVDPVTMKELMPAAGKYRIPAGHVMKARRVLHFLLYKAYARYPIPSRRRAVLRQIVDGFYERLFDPRHPSRLVSGAGNALGSKHMLLWLTDPAEQRFVEEMNWDGAIDVPERSDYLYVVEQNVGGNKLDYFQQHTYQMDVTPEASNVRVSTEVSVHNGVFLPQPRWSMGDSKSRHRPMVNVYVRPDARLLSATAPRVVQGLNAWSPAQFRSGRLETPSPAVWARGRPSEHRERGAKVWSGTLQIAPNQTGSLGFDYLVPRAIRTIGNRSVYRLAIQWQPKVRPDDLIVRFRLPDGARNVKAPGWRRDGRLMLFEQRLKSDLVLEVSWRT